MEYLRTCIWTAVIGFACMAGAIAFGKPEGAALVVAAVMVFLNL